MRVHHILYVFLALLVSTLASEEVVVEAKEDVGPLEFIRKQFQKLPEGGKFGVTAVGSFAVSKSAIAAVKVGAAAFVASEVLNAAGFLSDDGQGVVDDLKHKLVNNVNKYRTAGRRLLKGQTFRGWMEKEKMASLGAATGTIAGLLMN